ncbi:MAG: type II secretion system protein N [Magnetococcales bacterium]|nr:type II secretion system protein N [Magnetococcales bacterium]MBF0321766.1 type II secretion system protein N [Magnetococcales bacterium]
MMFVLRKWWFYGIVAVLSFIYFLFGNLPASFVYQLVSTRIAPLQLVSLSGTLWSGRADQMIYPPVQLDAVRWEVNPREIVRGKLTGLFYLGNSKQFRVRGRFDLLEHNRVRLRQVNGESSIPFVTNLFKGFPLRINGDIDLALDDFSLRENGFPEITGRVHLTGFEIGPPWKVFLGDLRLVFGMDGDLLNVQINDVRSPLIVDAKLQVWEAGRYRLKGDIEVRADTNKQAMEEFLRNNLGLVANNGRFSLNYTGDVPYFR